jgi:uncharacterized membrane protein YedE/YeeE
MPSGPELWLAAGGLILGIVFGAAAQHSRFCVVSAVSNLVLMRDYRQLHAWLAALAVALIGTGLLEWSAWVPVADSAYRRPSLDWLGSLGGGLVFGYGSMLAGGCASRTLVRVGEGNLGSFVALIAFAFTGMATLFGALEPLRGWVASLSLPLASGDASAATLVGLPQLGGAVVLAAACVAGLLFLGSVREHRGTVLAGALIGLAVVAGWWVTGVLGHDEFAERPPASLVVAGPLARSFAWLTMRLSTTGTLFGLLFIPGVLVGAFASALLSRSFRWVAPAGDRVGAYLLGGTLMGAGAMFAGGCNIGQGLTGVATVSLGSLIAVVGILGGMLFGLWRMNRGGDET